MLIFGKSGYVEFFVLFLQLFCKFKIITRGKKSLQKNSYKEMESHLPRQNPGAQEEDSLMVGKHPEAECRVQEATLPEDLSLTSRAQMLQRENTGLGKGCEVRGEGRKMVGRMSMW